MAFLILSPNQAVLVIFKEIFKKDYQMCGFQPLLAGA